MDHLKASGWREMIKKQLAEKIPFTIKCFLLNLQLASIFSADFHTRKSSHPRKVYWTGTWFTSEPWRDEGEAKESWKDKDAYCQIQVQCRPKSSFSYLMHVHFPVVVTVVQTMNNLWMGNLCTWLSGYVSVPAANYQHCSYSIWSPFFLKCDIELL